MRRTLILILLGLAAALTVFLFSNTQEGRFFKLERRSSDGTMHMLSAQGISGTLPTHAGQISTTTVLTKPRYTGQDVAGQHWQIVAEQAEQQGGISSSVVILNDVRAMWSRASSTTPATKGGVDNLDLAARQAIYEQQERQLQLMGQVSVTGAGFNFTAPRMQVEVPTRVVKGTADGGEPVVITGTIGGYDARLTGRDFAAHPSSQTITLSGGVKARLVPGR